MREEEIREPEGSLDLKESSGIYTLEIELHLGV